MSTMQKMIVNKIYIYALLCMYIIMIWFSYTYKTDPYLWFDEAGQFWISKGLNHDSDPLSTQGNLFDVIINNQMYNLDPGGFSIILHVWSMFSNHYLWLRLLPFLFFVFTVIGWIYLSYQWTKDKFISLCIGFVPLLVPMLYNEAFEIRAYSMEVLGCVIGCIAIDSLQKRITYKRLLIWSLLLSIFMTSRYSFIIVAFVISTYVLYLIYKTSSSITQKILMLLVYSIPLVLTLIYVYFCVMKYQNPNASTLFYLPYLSENIKILVRVASIRHLFYLVLIVWSAFTFRDSHLLPQYTGLIYVTLVTNIIFLILSIFGLHPWSGDTTRCISMITLVIISFSAIIASLMKKTSQLVDFRIIVLIFISCRLLSLYKFDVKHALHRENALIHFQKIENKDKANKVYVDRWESPCMRYQFEYGLLKNDTTYPENFTFLKFRPHNLMLIPNEKQVTLSELYATQPDLDEEFYDNYSVLIMPEIFWYKSEVACTKWESISNKNIVWIRKKQ